MGSGRDRTERWISRAFTGLKLLFWAYVLVVPLAGLVLMTDDDARPLVTTDMIVGARCNNRTTASRRQCDYSVCLPGVIGSPALGQRLTDIVDPGSSFGNTDEYRREMGGDRSALLTAAERLTSTCARSWRSGHNRVCGCSSLCTSKLVATSRSVLLDDRHHRSPWGSLPHLERRRRDSLRRFDQQSQLAADLSIHRTPQVATILVVYKLILVGSLIGYFARRRGVRRVQERPSTQTIYFRR